MHWYYLILGYFLLIIALGLFSYRLHFLFTGRSVSGVVTNIITRKRTLTGNTNSTLIEISYKNSNGVDCKFEADNGLLIFFYKIADSVKLSEKNGKVIVSSLFNILTAPVFLFIMGCVILVFLA
ncbi:hypothetical protein [Cellvibrio polysaccharolyticus]|uniref:Uncharacterized protein n=1 Tax=Cellvibrio polysaccharolyticus TaxID=2082724 RepID=A0A928YT17_9GAMM|nr:hypothetical protein [Cellvibrio polysaccharolyticus]MBE8716549.1 hypothetical protein [Cellvibrio polysaccharolyticus]